MDITIFDLDIHNACKLCEKLESIDTSIYSNLCFHFEKMSYVEPAGMLLASSKIRQLKETEPNVSISFKNASHESCNYANYMNFFYNSGFFHDTKSTPSKKFGSTYIPIESINFNELFKKGSGKLPQIEIEEYSLKLAKVLCQDEKNLVDKLKFLLFEIIRNVNEHSESSKVWIAAQNWYNKKEIEIAIFDEGIGIKNSLTKNPKYSHLDNDWAAIIESMKPGVTRAVYFDKNNIYSNSGYGLYISSQFCKNYNGTFTIISGNTLMQYENNKLYKYEFPSPGTLIRMRISSDSLDTKENIFNQIAKEGEKTAKETSGIFHSASKASRNEK